MSDLKVIPFKPEHMDGFTPKSVFNDGRDMKADAIAYSYAPGAHTGTIFLEGKPVGIVGLAQPWPGVAEVWTILSDKIRQSPVGVTKLMRRLLDGYMTELGIWRAQMTVIDGHDEGMRWAKLLGFECEGKLRKFGPDAKDHWMFGRVK